jgi:hypothetical protein
MPLIEPKRFNNQLTQWTLPAETSEKEFFMRHIFSSCAAFAAPALVGFVLITSPSVHAQDNMLSGTYAFTLAETCVQQSLVGTFSGHPGFDPTTLQILDSFGAISYGGASDGLLTFDGKGGVTLSQGRATNIMNAPSSVAPPQDDLLLPGSVPLGLGFGAAIPFTCTGTYNVAAGKISLNLTCNATVAPNPIAFGFSSTFNMTGWVPQGNRDHLLLTDIGNAVQPVTIFLKPSGTLHSQRICTRSTNLVALSSSNNQNQQ